ncbi:hypothetical protein IAE22_27775, partial [Bacillus sp. S34]|nr:hypothetical protein [Bacillus sp. S34]
MATTATGVQTVPMTVWRHGTAPPRASSPSAGRVAQSVVDPRQQRERRGDVPLVPGERSHYFRAEADVWGSWLASERKYLDRQRDIIGRGLTVVEAAGRTGTGDVDAEVRVADLTA